MSRKSNLLLSKLPSPEAVRQLLLDNLRDRRLLRRLLKLAEEAAKRHKTQQSRRSNEERPK